MVAFLNGHVLKNTDQPGEMHLFFSLFFYFDARARHNFKSVLQIRAY